jgi:hypothetical protein
MFCGDVVVGGRCGLWGAEGRSSAYGRHRGARALAAIGIGVLLAIVTCSGTASARTVASPSKSALPGAPTEVAASPGNASATVSWAPPSRAGSSAVTGYTISPSRGSTVRVGDVTSDVVTGLKNGTAYTFTVAAVNRSGTGPASGRSNQVTPAPPVTTPPVSTPPVTTSGATSHLLPLYDSSASDWLQACSTLSGTDSFVIGDIGDPGGPGTSESTSWAANIGDCGASHVGVLGYVDTGFCQVPLATAESEVDEWYSWYGADGLSGVYFDEAVDPADPSAIADCLSQTTSAVSYYGTLAAYVHEKATGQTVALNVGANPVSNWPFSSTSADQNADIVVIFEDPYSEYLDYGGSGAAWSPAPWETGYSAQHFALLVYDATGASQPAAACSAIALQNVGYAFITPEASWTSLPPAQYLAGESTDC